MTARLKLIAVFLSCVTPMVGQSQSQLSHPVVVGAPYWATRLITTEQKGPDGKPVRHIESHLEARNSQGWEFYREPLETQGLAAAERAQLQGKNPMTNVLWNPETRERIEWRSNNKTAQVISYGATAQGPSADAPMFATMDDLLSQFEDRTEFTSTRIGTKSMLQLQVQGVRSSRSQRVNLNGEDKEISTSVEMWYSPALHVPLSAVAKDSKGGTVSSSIIAIRRGEPDPALFHAPDLRVVRDRAARKLNVKAIVAKHRQVPVEPQVAAAEPEPVKEKPSKSHESPADGAQTEMASVEAVPAPGKATAPTVARWKIDMPPAVKTEKPLKVAKLKVYKNVPPGWPPGLPPL